MDPIPALYIILPLFAAFLIPVAGTLISGFQKTFSSLILLLLVAYSLFYYLESPGESFVTRIGGWEDVNSIPIAIYLVLDGLSAFLLLIINIIGFLSIFYAISYMKYYTAQNNFYSLFCLMIAGMNGVVLSGDIFNIYIFLEIAVISSYALVAFGDRKSVV